MSDFSNMTTGHATIRAAEASEDNRGGLLSEFTAYDLVDLSTGRVALVPRDASVEEHVLYLVDGGTRLVVDDVLTNEEWEELTGGPQA